MIALKTLVDNIEDNYVVGAHKLMVDIQSEILIGGKNGTEIWADADLFEWLTKVSGVPPLKAALCRFIRIVNDGRYIDVMEKTHETINYRNDKVKLADLVESDRGRIVIHYGPNNQRRYGTIYSWDNTHVFVDYDNSGEGIATNQEYLEFQN